MSNFNFQKLLQGNEKILWSASADYSPNSESAKKEMRQALILVFVFAAIALYLPIRTVWTIINGNQISATANELTMFVIAVAVAVSSYRQGKYFEDFEADRKTNNIETGIMEIAIILLFSYRFVMAVVGKPSFERGYGYETELIISIISLILVLGFFYIIRKVATNTTTANGAQYSHYLITNKRVVLSNSLRTDILELRKGDIVHVYVFQPKSSNYLTISLVDDPDDDNMIGLGGVADWGDAERLIADNFI